MRQHHLFTPVFAFKVCDFRAFSFRMIYCSPGKRKPLRHKQNTKTSVKQALFK
nr:MAG TPA: hypothetical protein [Bacteriophage sp.]